MRNVLIVLVMAFGGFAGFASAQPAAVQVQSTAALSEPDPRATALDRAFVDVLQKTVAHLIAAASPSQQTRIEQEIYQRPRPYIVSFRVDEETDSNGQKRLTVTVKPQVVALRTRLLDLGVAMAEGRDVILIVHGDSDAARDEAERELASWLTTKGLRRMDAAAASDEAPRYEASVRCAAGSVLGRSKPAAFCAVSVRNPRGQATRAVAGAYGKNDEDPVLLAVREAMQHALTQERPAAAGEASSLRAGATVVRVSATSPLSWAQVASVRGELRRAKLTSTIWALAPAQVDLLVAGDVAQIDAVLRAVMPDAKHERAGQLIRLELP